MKPKIAISMGDPAGISPEIIALSVEEIAERSISTIFGHRPTMESLLDEKQRALIDWDLSLNETRPGRIAFVNCGTSKMPIDSVGPECAEAQLAALSKATVAMLKGEAPALVTAPVAKNAISTILPSFMGHTEYLAERAGLKPDDVTMMFAADKLSVGLVSTHIALSDVPSWVTPKRLRRTFTHIVEMLRLTHPNERPKIAVAALNPHAGEDGLFGTEEQTIIEPFCKEAAAMDVADVFEGKIGTVPNRT
jgi:4-hydroxy-L-threonine phosphate dehydrogenase PdxA